MIVAKEISMVRRRRQVGYGLTNALQNLSPEPVVAQRDPNSNDTAELGTIWSNEATLDVFILAAYVGGAPQWLNVAGGAGVFDSVTATLGNITANLGNIIATAGDIIATAGDITASAGTISGLVGDFTGITVSTSGITSTGSLTIGALGAGVVQTDAAGLVFSDNGTNGQVLVGGGTEPNWANITSTGGSIAITNGANSINIETSGAAGTSEVDGDSGMAAPAAGVITLAGGANITTSAAAATVTVDLDSSVSVTGSITAGTSLEATTTVTAGTGVTVTTGDLDITAGNLTLPATDNVGADGVIEVNGSPFIHIYSSNTATLHNLFMGFNSGNFTNAVAQFNIGVGTDTLNLLAAGDYNTIIGHGAGAAISGGLRNSAVGASALATGDFMVDNIAIGYQSLNLATGDENTAIGSGAGSALTTGDTNTFIGFNAGSSYTTESNNIALGNVGTVADSGVIRIGTNGTHTTAYCAGIYGVTTASATTAAVLVSDGDQLGTIASSVRYKENIVDMGDFSDLIMDLSCRMFEYKKRPGEIAWGLVAEEVEEVFPWIVNYDKEGRPDSVRYHDLPTLLLDQLQKMQKRVEVLQEKAQKCKCQ